MGQSPCTHLNSLGPFPTWTWAFINSSTLHRFTLYSSGYFFPNSLAMVQQPRRESTLKQAGCPSLGASLDYPTYIFEKFLFCRIPSPFEKRSSKILPRAILPIKCYFSQTKQWSIICHLQYISRKEISLNIIHWINDAALNLKQELSGKHICHCTLNEVNLQGNCTDKVGVSQNATQKAWLPALNQFSF